MWHGHLRTTTPNTRVNDDLILNSYFWDVLLRNYSTFQGKTHQGCAITGMPNDLSTRFFASFLNQCFVYVITETVADYPYTFFTEKTWKAMVSKTPFMLVGTAGSLKNLRSFGFKTFNAWWSEDYDLLPTASERIEALVLELKKLSLLSPADLSDLRTEMQPIIDYNFNHMKVFAQADLDNIRKNI